MNRLFGVITVVVSALMPLLAVAGGTVPPVDNTNLPEPGTFELLALGGVVAAIIAVRNWRRK